MFINIFDDYNFLNLPKQNKIRFQDGNDFITNEMKIDET